MTPSRYFIRRSFVQVIANLPQLVAQVGSLNRCRGSLTVPAEHANWFSECEIIVQIIKQTTPAAPRPWRGAGWLRIPAEGRAPAPGPGAQAGQRLLEHRVTVIVRETAGSSIDGTRREPFSVGLCFRRFDMRRCSVERFVSYVVCLGVVVALPNFVVVVVDAGRVLRLPFVLQGRGKRGWAHGVGCSPSLSVGLRN